MLQVNMGGEMADMHVARKADAAEMNRRQLTAGTDGSVAIAHRAGNTYESWLTAKPGGKLVQASENDGWAFLRNGPCRHERELTVEEAKRLWPAYAGDIDTALRMVRAKERALKTATVAEIDGEIRLRGYEGEELMFEATLTRRRAEILAHDLLGAALRLSEDPKRIHGADRAERRGG
jgi:hypothetical protein